jgi:precorrin-6B methylase 1
MRPPDHLVLPDLIPDVGTVRRRLAVVLTEADLLRSQLRVSERLTREQERLRRQRPAEEMRRRA